MSLIICPNCSKKNNRQRTLGSVSADGSEFSYTKNDQVMGTLHGDFTSFQCQCGYLIDFQKLNDQEGLNTVNLKAMKQQII